MTAPISHQEFQEISKRMLGVNCLTCHDSGFFEQRCFSIEDDRWRKRYFECPHCKGLYEEPSNDPEEKQDGYLAMLGTALKHIEDHLDEINQWWEKAETVTPACRKSDQELVDSSALIYRIRKKLAALSSKKI